MVLRKKRPRRYLAGTFIVLGVVLMLFAPESTGGWVLLAAAAWWAGGFYDLCLARWRCRGGGLRPTGCRKTALMLSQASLSLEQAPPISVPFRFFLTAPLFLFSAGILLLVMRASSMISGM